MSSIHYKFRSLLSFKTINFQTLHVTAEEVKCAILEAEQLSPDVFDLVIEASYSSRQYSGSEIIPRNSAVIIKRVPRADTVRLPKVQDTTNSGSVSETRKSARPPNLRFIDTTDYNKMSEAERLEYTKKVSYQKYHPVNYHRKPTYASTGPPPSVYTCNRCNNSGHWVKDCPLANLKRATGIPIRDLVETTPDDPYAMIHPSGRLMVQRMHVKARKESKARAVSLFYDMDSKQEDRRIQSTQNEDRPSSSTVASLKSAERPKSSVF